MGELQLMEEKAVKESIVTISLVMMPEHANPAGNIHGGVIMKYVDNAGAVVAFRHARCNSVTASIDRFDFHNPVFVGNLLTLRASLNLVGKSSMETGVRVEAEDLFTGETRHIASAYLTYVALDDNSKPGKVPGLICETKEEKRRNRDAEARRKIRLAERKMKKQKISEERT